MEYTVAIIDDEHDVRQRLKKFIKTNPYNFKITSEYENGMDAYEGIIASPVDLIITDIKIPYIEGIELARKIKMTYPFVKVVFITGYNEIDYAKQAIELESIGFISKPIGKEEILSILQKAKAKIDEDIKLNTSLKELEILRDNSIAATIENDLCRLLQMNNLSIDFIQKLKNENVSLDYKYFMLGVFDFDIMDDNIDFNKAEITFFTLKKALMEERKSQFDFNLFKKGSTFIVLIKSNNKFQKRILETIFLAQFNKVNKYLNLGISVGFSNFFSLNDSFKKHYKEAKRALNLRSMVGGMQVLFFHEQDSLTNQLFFEKENFKKIEKVVRYGTDYNVINYLDSIKKDLSQNLNQVSFNILLIDIINRIIKSCNKIEDLNQKGFNLHTIYDFVIEAKTIDSIFNLLLELINTVRKINKEDETSIVIKNLYKVDEYILDNFMDKNINLEQLSDHVNLSQSYISSLLKKQKNTSFVKIVTELRMEKAKELLMNPNYKIVDVAYMVGYNEPYYFSHCFKKYYGKSPREYRENL